MKAKITKGDKTYTVKGAGNALAAAKQAAITRRGGEPLNIVISNG